MQITIDRTSCDCWQGACESCFGWRLLKLMEEGELHPASCQVEAKEDGQVEFTFLIHDRDHQDKVLKVTKDNWHEAYEAWPELLKQQQKKIQQD